MELSHTFMRHRISSEPNGYEGGLGEPYPLSISGQERSKDASDEFGHSETEQVQIGDHRGAGFDCMPSEGLMLALPLATSLEHGHRRPRNCPLVTLEVTSTRYNIERGENEKVTLNTNLRWQEPQPTQTAIQQPVQSLSTLSRNSQHSSAEHEAPAHATSRTVAI